MAENIIKPLEPSWQYFIANIYIALGHTYIVRYRQIRLAVLFHACLHHDGMCASCKFWRSKHWLNFLLLSDVTLHKCGKADAALTSVSIITTFLTVNQHWWPTSTSNWYRCLPPVLSVCLTLPFTPTQMWKNSLIHLFMLCSVSGDVPTNTTMLSP